MPGLGVRGGQVEGYVLALNDCQIGRHGQGNGRMRVKSQFAKQRGPSALAVLFKGGIKGRDGAKGAIGDLKHGKCAGQHVAASAIPGYAQSGVTQSLEGKARSSGIGPDGQELLIGCGNILRPDLREMITREEQGNAAIKVFRDIEGSVRGCEKSGLAA